MLLKLNISAEHQGAEFSTENVSDKDSLLIGRDGAVDVQIPYTRLSRKHCRITKRQDQYTVADMGSTHGTKLNERVLVPNEAVPLRDGDLLHLADVVAVSVSIFRPEAGETTGEIARERLQTFLGTETGLDPYLLVLSGRHKDQQFALHGSKVELLVGRSDECDVVVDDANASRRHALIVKDTLRLEGVVYRCLGAKNESTINGQRLPRDGEHRLVDRDVVQIGDVRLMFVNPGEDIERQVRELISDPAPAAAPMEPAKVEPQSVEPVVPVSVEPAKVDPVDPPAVVPAAADPTAADPTSADPANAVPASLLATNAGTPQVAESARPSERAWTKPALIFAAGTAFGAALAFLLMLL